MAFDWIPHCVLLQKTFNVKPDKWWRIMHVWYSNIYVNVKWPNRLSASVKLEKGTTQGGLTSPFLFNLCYPGLTQNLSNSSGGLRIKTTSYNVFIYADDLLLISTTVSGLQTLIKCSNHYPMTRLGTTRILCHGILQCRSPQCRDLPSVAMSILLLSVIATMVS